MKTVNLPIILACLASLVTSQRSITLPQPSEASTNLSAGRYHQFACEPGSQRTDVALSCITILDELHRTSADPVTFNYRYWEDKASGCHITATAWRPSYTLIVRDLPDDLLFLLYRCFLATRSEPARSASIDAGQGDAYRIRIYPPRGREDQNTIAAPSPSVEHPPLPGHAANQSISSNISTGLANWDTSSRERSNVRCSRKALHTTAKCADCIATLMQIVNDPRSAAPYIWRGGDTREWYVPNCRITVAHPVSYAGKRDVFSLRSLIDDALWIMGKCFAGPEADRGMNSGVTAVGPTKQWKLIITLGIPLAGDVESS